MWEDLGFHLLPSVFWRGGRRGGVIVVVPMFVAVPMIMTMPMAVPMIVMMASVVTVAM